MEICNVEKLKNIGTRLKKWNKDTRGNIPRKITHLREEL